MEMIVNYIKNNASQEHPISNKEICSALNVSEVIVRKKINKARCEGIPICSCSQGYYYSDDKYNILDTIQSLMHRTISVEKAINGMLTTVKGMEDVKG
jgi:biotin operon repressor